MGFDMTTTLRKLPTMAVLGYASSVLTNNRMIKFGLNKMLNHPASGTITLLTTTNLTNPDLDTAEIFMLSRTAAAQRTITFNTTPTDIKVCLVANNNTTYNLVVMNGAVVALTLTPGKVAMIIVKYENPTLYVEYFDGFLFGFSPEELSAKTTQGDTVMLSHLVPATLSANIEVNIPGFQVFNTTMDIAESGQPSLQIPIADLTFAVISQLNADGSTKYAYAFPHVVFNKDIAVQANQTNKMTFVYKKEVAPATDLVIYSY